jgi:hypothetical protein
MDLVPLNEPIDEDEPGHITLAVAVQVFATREEMAEPGEVPVTITATDPLGNVVLETTGEFVHPEVPVHVPWLGRTIFDFPLKLPLSVAGDYRVTLTVSTDEPYDLALKVIEPGR